MSSMEYSGKLQMGKSRRSIIAFLFELEGITIFWENLYDQSGYFVGLFNFIKFFHMKGSSPILLITSIFITIPVAIFLVLGAKKLLLVSLLIYCICSITKSILVFPKYFHAEEISHVIGVPEANFLYYFERCMSTYIMKAIAYFVLLFFIISFMMSKKPFTDIVKKFWWIPGVFRCCAAFLLMFVLCKGFAYDVRGMYSVLFYNFFNGNIEIPFLMFDVACCQTIELFLLGWWLTHHSQQHLENAK